MTTTTRTTTHTLTKTLEEAAVLRAIEACHRDTARKAAWTMPTIQAIVDSNAVTLGEQPVPEWLTPVIVGQLIERGLIYRTATDPESYVRA